MPNLTPLIVNFHAHMEAALNKKLLSRFDKDLHVKVVGWGYLGIMPAAYSGVFLWALLGDKFDPDVSLAALAILILFIFFGITLKTDRIYDENKAQIRELAWDLRNDPHKGVWRVRLVVFGGLLVGFVFVPLVILALKWRL